jgi:hypothetical protein
MTLSRGLVQCRVNLDKYHGPVLPVDDQTFSRKPSFPLAIRRFRVIELPAADVDLSNGSLP